MPRAKDQQPLTDEQTEALGTRVQPFLDELYKHCFKLCAKKQLTLTKLDELAKKHGLDDLNITPQLLLPVITATTEPLFKKASTEAERIVLAQSSGISPIDILNLQRAVFLTNSHLLALSGQPVGSAFQELYAPQPQV